MTIYTQLQQILSLRLSSFLFSHNSNPGRYRELCLRDPRIDISLDKGDHKISDTLKRARRTRKAKTDLRDLFIRRTACVRSHYESLWQLKLINTRKEGKVIPLQAYVAQMVGRGIALIVHDRDTRRRWVVSSTSRPHFTPGERPGTHFTGGWVGTRAGLDGRKFSSPAGFDPGTSSP